MYDFVHGKIKYRNNGNESLGPDVIATVDGDIMFLDSKTFVPLKDQRFLIRMPMKRQRSVMLKA